MLSDIEIAQRAELKPIREIAEKIGIPSEDVENYGQYKDVETSVCFSNQLG